MSHRWQAGTNAFRTMTRRVRESAARLRQPSDRRKSGRIKGGQVYCSRGDVLDISAGGMRLRSRRRLEGQLEMELRTHHRRVTLQTRIIWCKRVGFRKFDIGVQFVDLTAIGLYARHN
jgi:hypothetical protein